MKKFTLAGFVATFLFGLVACGASPLPEAEKEREWLQTFVGDWDAAFEIPLAPGKAQKCQGTESVRSIGGIWTVADSQVTFMGSPVKGVITLGYDSQKKKYVGSKIDSLTNTLWIYEGTLDAKGTSLTLETKGPRIFDPKEQSLYRDVLELKSKDHKVLTSFMQGEDGQWTTILTIDYRRKK